MKAIIRAALAGVGLLCSFSLCAANTGYPVALNIPLVNTDPSQKPIVIVAMCYATTYNKDLDGWVGQNNPATVQDIVASESGGDRMSITIVVPFKWSYQVLATVQPSNNAVPVGVCKATAWHTE
jgi:hypothetical protein